MKAVSIFLAVFLVNVVSAEAGLFASLQNLRPKPPSSSRKKRKSVQVPAEVQIPNVNLRLEGIISGKRSYAFINGKIRKVRDRVGNCVILEILPERRVVKLKCSGRIFKLKLNLTQGDFGR